MRAPNIAALLVLLITAGCAHSPATRDAYAADYLWRCQQRAGTVQGAACMDIYRSNYPEHAAKTGRARPAGTT